MTLKQQIGDLQKDAAQNAKALEQWQLEHDKLKLVEIESVSFFDYQFLCVDLSLVTMMTTTRMRTRIR